MKSYLILVRTLLCCVCWCNNGFVSGKLYEWTQGKVNFPSAGKYLDLTPMRTTYNRHLVTQCAMDCLKDSHCESYNFLPAAGVCQLHDSSHRDVGPSTLRNNDTSQYFLKETFSIDQAALGPCAAKRCQNGGVCLDTSAQIADSPSAVCVCPGGWEGELCDVMALPPSWASWEVWGECSVTCGTGWRLRTRQCTDPLTNNTIDSLMCRGRDTDIESCDLQECPRWQAWGSWSACSAETTCGRGHRTRTRGCSNGGTPGVDRYCLGSRNQTGLCQGIDCRAPVRLQGGAVFGEGQVELFNDRTKTWGLICADNWDANAARTACKQMGFPDLSEVITDGRYPTDGRTISVANFSCPTEGRILQKCSHSVWDETTYCMSSVAAGIKCKVDGDWNMWSGWGECSVTCGDGTQTRTRQCDLPPTLHGGKPCEGPASQERACAKSPCPGSGVWGPWGPWEACDVTCGDGSQQRHRTCVDTEVSCSGESDEVQTCATSVPCPVDGMWSHWGSWSECDLMCGGGLRFRHRNCSSPRHGGRPCIGKRREQKVCNEHPCPVDGFSLPWTELSDCSLSCGNGTQSRMRDCNPPKHGGLNCSGASLESQDCNGHHCPVDGHWQEWTQWSVCTVSCGTGSQTRMRVCNNGKHGGLDCVGESWETQACNPYPCPVAGYWRPWGDWSQCGRTCGNGTRTRTRVCVPPQHGGADCDGSAVESENCYLRHCPVAGYWRPWGDWSQCGRTCGNGTRTRTRVCVPPQHGGADCDGSGAETEECNLRPCPVDGFWQPWSAWSECGLSCGNGTQTRTRDCYPAKYGGLECSGESRESRECNTHPCPEDGVWTSWSPWSDCPVTCGGDQEERHRVCDGPRHGGEPCTGEGTDLRTCNQQPCPVDGLFQPWSEWGECSLQCGGGVKTRTRDCTQPLHGGLDCDGDGEESEACNSHPCPEDGVWTSWSPWSDCPVTCGGDQEERYRVCDGPRHGGEPCTGEGTDLRTCNQQPCPVDGVFQPWSDWGECSLQCGGGVKTRTRDCTQPLHGGLECEGDGEESEVCNSHPCPVDGEWQEWTTWGQCTVTCGGGTSQRERVCAGTAHGGRECQGSSWEVEECSSQPCPVDGVYGDWSDWEACSVSCGGGTKRRTRDCTPPLFGGKDCEGEGEEEGQCNTHLCPVDGEWADWAIWGTCSVTCGGGTRKRERVCTGQAHGGRYCDGMDWEVENCNTVPCPIDGEFTSWSVWGECSATCGGGTQTRDRDCILPQYGGKPCNGDRYQIQDCGMDDCPVDGRWNIWGEWGSCSVSCGSGTQERKRTCDGPYFGGEPCDGSSSETTECQQPACLIPGDWGNWSDWSLCSTTCDGGTRKRDRKCDMTSHGELTAPCEGDAEEIETCHDFPCQPYASSCSALKSAGLIDSGEAEIDPDGPGGKTPVTVFCDLQSEGGVGVTVIHHDHEEEEEVDGYEGAGEYDTGNLVYKATWEQILALIGNSERCKQYISWKCHAALIHNYNSRLLNEGDGGFVLTTYWRNRTGGKADYFGGATPGSNSCACGMTQSCAKPGDLCNCDANDSVWREDAGFITVKEDLPVKSFAAGDTGKDGIERGIFTIGKLLCAGEDDD